MAADAETLFEEIADAMEPEGVTKGTLFGKPCLKVRGKAFSCFFKGAMVFKLDDDGVERAKALRGASLFDPSGSDRPMRQWVQVPFSHRAQWHKLAEEARQYVESSAR
jgi:hypothetical protein